METTTSTSTIINFGKYNGKSISEIASEDIKWLIWLVNNYNVYANYSPNRYVTLKKSTIDYRKQLISEASTFVNTYFDTIKQTNIETSKSQHIGTLGKRQSFNVTVKKIKIGYDKIIAIDENGNEIFFYDKDYNLQIGQSIEVIGTPTKHTESLGIKQTYINRTKIK